MSTLERAIAIAAEAHAGQVDKAGQPYILHSLRVMMNVRGNNERIVAVLHDVLEDCPDWSRSRLHDTEGFGAHIVDALDRLTRRKGEAYIDFIKRCQGPLSQRVKIADLQDNLDPMRLSMIPANPDRVAKYQVALALLTAPESDTPE